MEIVKERKIVKERWKTQPENVKKKYEKEEEKKNKISDGQQKKKKKCKRTEDTWESTKKLSTAGAQMTK